MSRLIAICLTPLIFYIAGCSTQTTTDSSGTSTQVEIADPVQQLLQQAAQSADATNKARYQLQAASLAFQQGNITQTESILALINYPIQPQIIQEQYMLIALALAEEQGDINKVASLINAIPPHFYQKVSPDIQRKAGELKAYAYDMLGQHLRAATERNNVSGFYSGDEYWANHEEIWRSLSKTPTSELSQQREKSENYELEGWLQLATDIKQNQISLEQQLGALSAWKAQWPQHPAALKLPEELALLSSLPERRPDTIALALPLSGTLGNAGKAVRDGFMATFYADNYRVNANTEITLYDTHGKNFSSLYQEMVMTGPDLIIGPLDKSSLTQLESMDSLPIPVLALNYLNDDAYIPFQLYQFGLSAEDEARQIADKLWINGARQVVTVMPESDWGQRVFQAFSKHWESRNGEIVNSAFFDKNKNLSKTVEKLLSVDQSKLRARAVRNTIVESIEFTPRRRQDFDAIVMVAKPKTARQLKPLFAFHFAGNIPIYSTSQIYSGTPAPQKDQDLNGVRFTETPWVLSKTNHIKHQAHQLLPKQSQRYDRLFALGSDTYKLAPRLILLERISGSQVSGQTGLLSMNEKKQILRTLDWARFIDGEPHTER